MYHDFHNYTHVECVEEVTGLTLRKRYEIDHVEGVGRDQYVHIKQNDFGEEDWFCQERFIPVEKENPVKTTPKVGQYVLSNITGCGITSGTKYKITGIDSNYQNSSKFFIINDNGEEDHWYLVDGDFEIVEGDVESEPTNDSDVTVSTIAVSLRQLADEEAGYHVDDNNMNIEVVDGNGEAYVVIKTERWALNADEIDRFAARLKAVLALKGNI